MSIFCFLSADIKELCYLHQQTDIRHIFTSFPSGYCSAGYTQFLSQLLLRDFLLFAKVFEKSPYF